VPTADELLDATEALVALDPAYRPVVDAIGPCTMGLGPHRDPTFAVLASSICHQQLAGAAARTIHGRFVAACGGRPTPATVLALGEAPLRAAGLSAAKAASVLDLAERAADGRLHLGSLHRRDDEAVIAELVQVRGIGRWTAEMFLMFRLGRLDVWPVDDLGVRMGWGLVHDLPERPTPRALADAGDAVRPVRSVAAWYCWRAVDLHRAG
jgi:3-methyladenine DNA glycosylase/8-oxoguanine DNA glycosylase